MDYSVFRSVIQGTREMAARIPPPSHRHGSPSGPWPFLDVEDEIDTERLGQAPPLAPARVCDHQDANTCKNCWTGYPQSLFPNWTNAQQKKSRISKIVGRSQNACTIHYVDVAEDGLFTATEDIEVTDTTKDAHWEFMRAPRPTGTRLRAMFVEHLSGPVLQMLGTKYNVEPFFFSSSLGWIPSRYQASVQLEQGDHITITLAFIRPMLKPNAVPLSSDSSYISSTLPSLEDLVIDTQAPLPLRSSDIILLPDLLSLHMHRSKTNSTIISYHAGPEYRVTTARDLHRRLSAAGRSVYWNNIFAHNDDPTFVFLVLLWYALYAWDETLEALYAHICSLEARVIHTNDINLTQELHIIQAHLLHYAILLDEFKKTVIFVLETPNPALDDTARYSPEVKLHSEQLLKQECGNLLREIRRLEGSRSMQSMRLQNVMNLGFNYVNLEDSRHMGRLREASVKDSAALKQVAYLTMFFLPGTLIANIFGMNVGEINPGTLCTLPLYVSIVIPLTLVSIWGIVALQFNPRGDTERDPFGEFDREKLDELSVTRRTLERIGWPVIFVRNLVKKCRVATRKSGFEA